MAPVYHPLHKLMFDRIEVNVVYMPLKVRRVTNCMFPVAPLPYAILAARILRGRYPDSV